MDSASKFFAAANVFTTLAHAPERSAITIDQDQVLAGELTVTFQQLNYNTDALVRLS